MDSDPLACKPRQRDLSRREAIGAAVAFAAPFARPSPSVAAETQNPPVFATLRHQFTLVSPSAQLTSVSLFNQAGKDTQLSTATGKVTLIGFWATWCEACQEELRLLDNFHTAARGTVNVVAVSIDDPTRLSDIEPYLAKLSLASLPILLDPNGRLATLSSQPAAPLSLFGYMPVTYLITPSGRAVGFIAGAADWQTPPAQRLISYYATG